MRQAEPEQLEREICEQEAAERWPVSNYCICSALALGVQSPRLRGAPILGSPFIGSDRRR
jgi:hypothetical protein